MMTRFPLALAILACAAFLATPASGQLAPNQTSGFGNNRIVRFTYEGSSGITSVKMMDDAEAAGRAIEAGSNFFLFFRSDQVR